MVDETKTREAAECVADAMRSVLMDATVDDYVYRWALAILVARYLTSQTVAPPEARDLAHWRQWLLNEHDAYVRRMVRDAEA